MKRRQKLYESIDRLIEVKCSSPEIKVFSQTGDLSQTTAIFSTGAINNETRVLHAAMNYAMKSTSKSLGAHTETAHGEPYKSMSMMGDNRPPPEFGLHLSQVSESQKCPNV